MTEQTPQLVIFLQWRWVALQGLTVQEIKASARFGTMICCHVVALLLLFLPSAVAGDLVPAPVPQTSQRFLSQTVPELTTCCDNAHAQPEATLVLQDFQEYLSYETVYPNGTCTPTTVESEPPCKRHGEETVEAACATQVADYGIDRWFSISGNHFLMNYPFSGTVKISMGCMVMLMSEWHVLTATHCIHDSKDYVKGAKKIKVGFVTPAQGAGNRMGMGRLAMCWAWVQHTQMPMGWIWGPNSVSVNYNCALWELCRPCQCLHMKLMAAPAAEKMAGKKINFSGFDSDQPGELVYCFCGVEDEMVCLSCQRCNASLVHPALGHMAKCGIPYDTNGRGR